MLRSCLVVLVFQQHPLHPCRRQMARLDMPKAPNALRHTGKGHRSIPVRHIQLGQHGYDGPILMLEGFFKADELQVFSQWQLDTVIHCTDQIQTLTLTQLSQPLNVFLKLNTGMNRLGFTLEEAAAAFDALKQLPQVRSVTVMTHFADADNDRGTGWQLERLAAAWPEASAHLS